MPDDFLSSSPPKLFYFFLLRQSLTEPGAYQIRWMGLPGIHLPLPAPRSYVAWTMVLFFQRVWERRHSYFAWCSRCLRFDRKCTAKLSFVFRWALWKRSVSLSGSLGCSRAYFCFVMPRKQHFSSGSCLDFILLYFILYTGVFSRKQGPGGFCCYASEIRASCQMADRLEDAEAEKGVRTLTEAGDAQPRD